MTSKDRHWTWLLALVGAVLVTFFVGLIVGISARNDNTHASIVSSMRIVEHGGRALIGIRCRGEYIAVYDPSTKIVDRNPSSLQASILTQALGVRAHKDFLLALLGGSSGAITLRGLMRTRGATTGKPRGGKYARAAGAIVGAVSGYLLGYWLGSYASGECDSRQALSAISSPEAWPEFMRSFFWVSLHEAGYVDKRFEASEVQADDLLLRQRVFNFGPIMNCQSELGELLDNSVLGLQAGRQVESQDLELLLRLDATLDRLLATPAHQRFASCLEGGSIRCFDQSLCKLLRGANAIPG